LRQGRKEGVPAKRSRFVGGNFVVEMTANRSNVVEPFQ
jgi:hypothetical protein